MSTVNEVKKKHIAKQCGTVTFCLKKNFNWYLYGKASGNIMYAKVLMEVVKLFLNRWNCAGFFFFCLFILSDFPQCSCIFYNEKGYFNNKNTHRNKARNNICSKEETYWRQQR